MTPDHELHLPDALAHAAVPPPAPPPPAAPGDALAVESGTIVTSIEDFFPLIWLGMLTVVSVVGIFNAVEKLP